MPNEPIRPVISAFQSQAELELLQIILQGSASCYPCNPAEPEAEAYFAALEQEVFKAGWTEEDFAIPAQSLAHQLNQLWDAVPAQDATSHILNTDFFQRFATQVPQHLLNSIVQRAEQVIASNLSLADQLVHAVQDCLPTWGEEDLQVLARPFAFAMRGSSETEVLEVALRSVRCAEWQDLSSIEQARLSLAIARYAIDQLPTAE
ncbi:MAG TPA: hypothetical protein V6C57_16390 [Coleofasciculaceae cyanobacterium]